MKKIMFFIVSLVLLFTIYGCFQMGGESGMTDASANGSYYVINDDYNQNGETYNQLNELPYIDASEKNESYISLDSSTAAYPNLRRMINNNTISNYPNSIRTDELINYFSYDFPQTLDTFSAYAEMGKAPWSEDHYLLTIGVKTKEVKIDRYAQGNNFVFLVDTSGSMRGELRIDLVKMTILMLIDHLNPNDTISLVTYASQVGTICSGVKVSNKNEIKAKVNQLYASGSTNGGQGLQIAYKVAMDNFIEGGNNRIILATDGDFNVGISNTTDLLEFIQEKAKSGVYITCLGYGMYNYRDDMMETIAKNGNGNYSYIDSIEEAKKVLIDEMDTALCTVAKDVKAMITFNPDVVSQYRLIGYENKTLTESEYNNEEADAGEIGSNHTTMICYELILKDSINANELCELEIKYKDPLNDQSLIYQNQFSELTLKEFNQTTEDFQFVSSIVEFSQILRNSNYLGSSSIEHVLETLRSLNIVMQDEYKNGFLTLVETYYENNK